MYSKKYQSLQESFDRIIGRRQLNEEIYTYNLVVSYLLDEGYADSLDTAEIIYENMSDEWFDTIVEVWGRGKVDPNYGTHNRDREGTSQKAGGRAMSRTPREKMQDKLARVKGLDDLRQSKGSERSPKNARRVRKISTALKRASDELAGQQVQNLEVRKRERKRYEND